MDETARFTAAAGSTPSRETSVANRPLPVSQVAVTTPKGHLPDTFIRCTSFQVLSEHLSRESMPEKTILTLYVVVRQSN